MRLPRLSRPRRRLAAALTILGVGAVAAGVTLVLLFYFTHSLGSPRVSAVIPRLPEATSQTATRAPSVTSTPTPLVTEPPVPSSTASAEQRPGPVRVPVLMYHHVGEPPPDADGVRLRLTVTASDFEAQLIFLSARGYATITLHDLAAALAGGSLPPKPVVLTFDDGYADNFDVAFPLLQRYGMTGVFFIASGFVGKDGYVTWEQVLALADAGMEVGAHSRWHSDLTNANMQLLEEEIARSKRDLEQRLGLAVDFFCYPAGAYNDGVIAALLTAGYAGAVTTRPGLADGATALFEIPRQRVAGGSTLAEFARLIGETSD